MFVLLQSSFHRRPVSYRRLSVCLKNDVVLIILLDDKFSGFFDLPFGSNKFVSAVNQWETSSIRSLFCCKVAAGQIFQESNAIQISIMHRNLRCAVVQHCMRQRNSLSLFGEIFEWCCRSPLIDFDWRDELSVVVSNKYCYLKFMKFTQNWYIDVFEMIKFSDNVTRLLPQLRLTDILHNWY